MSDLKKKFTAEQIFNRTLDIESGDVTVERSVSEPTFSGYISTVGKHVNEMTYMDLEKALVDVREAFRSLGRTYHEPWRRGNNGYGAHKKLEKEQNAIINKIKEIRPEFVRQRRERAQRTRDEQRATRVEADGSRIPMYQRWGSSTCTLDDYKEMHKYANYGLDSSDWLLQHSYFHKMAVDLGYVPDLDGEYRKKEALEERSWFGKLIDRVSGAFTWAKNKVKGWLGWS